MRNTVDIAMQWWVAMSQRLAASREISIAHSCMVRDQPAEVGSEAVAKLDAVLRSSFSGWGFVLRVRAWAHVVGKPQRRRGATVWGGALLDMRATLYYRELILYYYCMSIDMCRAISGGNT